MGQAGSQIHSKARRKGTKTQREREKEGVEKGGKKYEWERDLNYEVKIFSALAANQFTALPAATPRRPGNQQLNGPHYFKVTHIPHTHTHKSKHTNKTRHNVRHRGMISACCLTVT